MYKAVSEADNARGGCIPVPARAGNVASAGIQSDGDDDDADADKNNTLLCIHRKFDCISFTIKLYAF